MILVVPQRSRTKAWVVLVLVLLLAVVGSVSYLAWRQSVPGVRATLQAPRFLGHNTSFTVTLEAAHGNLRRSEVRVVQGGKPVTVATVTGLPPCTTRTSLRRSVPWLVSSVTMNEVL